MVREKKGRYPLCLTHVNKQPTWKITDNQLNGLSIHFSMCNCLPSTVQFVINPKYPVGGLEASTEVIVDKPEDNGGFPNLCIITGLNKEYVCSRSAQHEMKETFYGVYSPLRLLAHPLGHPLRASFPTNTTEIERRHFETLHPWNDNRGITRFWMIVTDLVTVPLLDQTFSCGRPIGNCEPMRVQGRIPED